MVVNQLKVHPLSKFWFQMSHQVDPGLKALGCQPVESTSPFKVVVSDVFNLHPLHRGLYRSMKTLFYSEMAKYKVRWEVVHRVDCVCV